jgi:hypothetical protein
MTALHNVMTVRSMRALVIAMALAGSTAACGNTTTAASTVSSLSIAGSVPSVGSSSQLTAIATLGDGSTEDVTRAPTWQSSNSDYATVSATGVITALSSGSVVVQATYSGVTGATTVDIP